MANSNKVETLKEEKSTADEGSLQKHDGLVVKLNEEAREFCEWIAKRPLVRGGMSIRAIRESLSADAFDSLTLDRIHRKLEKGYTEWTPQWPLLISNTQSVDDFRVYYGIITGGIDRMPEVLEKEPYLESMFSDDTVEWTPKKYGSLFGYSFEASTYDDLRLLDTKAAKLGAAAARNYEFFYFRTLLDANPTSYDGSNGVFGTVGSNVGTFVNTMATSAGLTTASLEAGIEVMLAQTALDSSTTFTDADYIPVQYIPKYLWVHTSQFLNARAILGSSHVAEDANNRINPLEDPYAGLQLRVTNYITSTNWYLQADPGMGANTMEAGLWGGKAGPEFFYEKPDTGHNFGFDEIRMKVRQIYGGALLDPRAWYLGTTSTS